MSEEPERASEIKWRAARMVGGGARSCTSLKAIAKALTLQNGALLQGAEQRNGLTQLAF